MGKKRSNRNKRKKNSKNGLQNSCDAKVNSAFHQNVQKEENSKSYSSKGTQKEISNIQLSNNAILYGKAISDSYESDPNKIDSDNALEKSKSLSAEDIKKPSHENTSQNLSAANISPACYHIKSNEISRGICSTSFNMPENENQYSSFTHMHQARSVTFDTCGIPIHVEYRSLSEFEDYPTSFFSEKESIIGGRIKPNSGFQSCPKEHNDRLTLSRYLEEEDSSCDEEYSTSDFFKPVFDDWYEGKGKVSPEKNFNGASKENSHCAENTFSSEASCSGFRISAEKSAFEGKLKGTISCSVDAYKSSKGYFSDVYHIWLPERRDTLQKLRTLHAEVHNDQLNYNKSQGALREMGLLSRSAKNPDNQVVNFLASFTAFLSDAASGMVSVAQAFNVDTYQSKFKEIMEHDAEITQRMFKARSRCVEKYHDIEEVMRKFHSENFSSTINKISSALDVDNYWEGMKNAYKKDDTAQLLDVVSKFFDNALQSSKLEEVSDSVQRYVDDNPAALDACKSAGRATYGALDTWGINRSQNRVLKGIDTAANQVLMIEDKLEIQRLRNTIDEDSPQSKIESQIEEAIDSLESELSEIKAIYFELFKSHDDDSDCDIYPSY